MTGQTVSHYRILEKIGGGGMGVVYLAEDTRLGRQVALKFLPESIAADPLGLDRFRREARAASAINHPNICTIYDIGQDEEGRPFLAMEYLEGTTLKHRIEEGRPVPLPQIADWAVQIADALDAAHSKGIIHRDIKPANLFITTRQQAKVLDFGLAKVAADRARVGPSDLTATLSVALETSSGSTVGTICYMSPEQARGEDLDARTDLFSFGAVLYELATGSLPFEGKTTALVFNALLTSDPIPPSAKKPAVPADFERIVMRLLEKDRSLRYQSAADLAADLRRVQRDSTQTITAARPVARQSGRGGSMSAVRRLRLLFRLRVFCWRSGISTAPKKQSRKHLIPRFSFDGLPPILLNIRSRTHAFRRTVSSSPTRIPAAFTSTNCRTVRHVCCRIQKE